MSYCIQWALCCDQTLVPWYEDESGWCCFTNRIRTLHRKLHGHRVNGETEEAKQRADGGNGSFLQRHQRHLRGGTNSREALVLVRVIRSCPVAATFTVGLKYWKRQRKSWSVYMSSNSHNKETETPSSTENSRWPSHNFWRHSWAT